MPHYAVVEMTMKNPDWITEYIPAVTKLVQEHGGTYLARTTNIEKIEGDRPTPDAVVLLAFPTREAMQGFYDDPAYEPYLAMRMAGTASESMQFPGEDIAAGG